MLAGDLSQERRGVIQFDGSVPFVHTYRTRDGGYVAVCAIGKRFFAALLAALDEAPTVDSGPVISPLFAAVLIANGWSDR